MLSERRLAQRTTAATSATVGTLCVLKLARTIVDLAGAPDIQTYHLAKAIQYRPQRRD